MIAINKNILVIILLGYLAALSSCGDDDGPGIIEVQVNTSGILSLLDVASENEVPFSINLSLPAMESVTLDIKVEGLQTNLFTIEPEVITINTSGASASGKFIFTGSIEDDTEYEVTISASAPVTGGQAFITGSEYTFTVLNSETAIPKANVKLWVPLGSPPQLYGYRSEIGGEVGEFPCRTNEFFAAPVQSSSNSNILGFNNPNPSQGTNIFDFIRIYADENISSLGGKNGQLGALEVLKFFPEFFGAKSGIIEVIEQELTVKRTGELPDFVIGISGSGIYDEDTGLINVTVIFDESDIGNGTVERSYEFPISRRPGGCSGD